MTNRNLMQKKILIVDDNTDSRELVIKVLKKRNYRLSEAMDGEEALRKIAAEKPDLILMDISLPKMDGYTVTMKLKEQDAFKSIPVIALTAHAMKGDREKALAAGCVAYITKPINIRTFPDIIEQYLE